MYIASIDSPSSIGRGGRGPPARRRRDLQPWSRRGMARMNDMGEEAAYPAHREADVVLRDGSTVHVRPVQPKDRPALLEFHRGLSKESLALRFFTGAVDLEWVM